VARAARKACFLRIREIGRVPTIRLALDRLATSEAIHPRTEPNQGD
jgi:hypothetical protein